MEENYRESKKSKKLGVISFILFLLLAVALMIPNLLEPEQQLSEVTGESELEAYNDHGKCGDFEAANPNVFKIPDMPGRQLYCIEAGKAVRYSNASVSYIEKYGSLYNSNTIGEEYSSRCGHARKPDNGLQSNTYYICTGDHFEPQADVAYVVTTEPLHEQSTVKQQAIWRSTILASDLTGMTDDSPGSSALHQIDWEEGVALIKEAREYAKFHERTKDHGLNARDVTDYDELDVNGEFYTKKFIVGPFKMDYEQCIYPGISGDIAFGGINDMYVVGDKTKRIEIEKFILVDPDTGREEEVTPRYFTPGENTKTDTGEQNYPKPGQEFYVKFKKPISDENIGRDEVDQEFTMHVDFSYLTISAHVCRLKGVMYTVNWHCDDTYDHEHCDDWDESCSTDKDGNEHCHSYCVSWYDHFSCESWSTLSQSNHQDLIDADGERSLLTESLDMPFDYQPKPVKITMELGGHVFEDQKENKETIPNGVLDSSEPYKKGVEVILYEKNGKEVDRTVTGEDGKYLFKKLDAMKKYYVEFVYDGQRYEHTIYNNNLSGGYSNATETPSERTTLNNTFAEIGSTPDNYKVNRTEYRSILGYSKGSWNKTYTRDEIKDIYNELIDVAASKGNYKEAYKTVLSRHGNSSEAKSMLQFIEDCRISAYTGSAGKDHIKYYPVVDNFVIRDRHHRIVGIDYDALYEDQRRIDFGISERQTVDIAIRKDVYKATLEINGKTQTYEYDKRKNLDDTYWDISARISDAYYKQNYTREIFKSDYDYKTDNYQTNSLNPNTSGIDLNQDKELKVFVTYRITVRNQSQVMLMQIKELVDYYDQDYTYEPGRSYIGDEDGKFVSDIQSTTTSRYSGSGYDSSAVTHIGGYNNLYIQGLQDRKLATGEDAYVYLTFSVNKDSNRNIKLDEDPRTAAKIGVGKENIIEVNGYKTYYKEGYRISSGERKSSNEVVGLVDVDSNPGNLNPSDVPKDGNINYKNFEDDTDKAPNIRLILHRDADRVVDGIVWDDERTEQAKDANGNATNAQIGNGLKESGEKGIDGVTVQLVELIQDKNNPANTVEYIWKEYKSGQKGDLTPVINNSGLVPNYTINNETGKYKFVSFMPGNYIIRFIYGDGTQTVLTSDGNNAVNKVYKANGQSIGLNEKSYSGQDYKSTTYQEGINQSSLGNYNGIRGYTNYDTQNERATYIYDFVAADNNPNASDAKDIMSRRNEVINYSNQNVTNNKAEVLASSYNLPSYGGTNYSYSEMKGLVDSFIQNTQMKAETGFMNVELEYNRTVTGEQGDGNKTTYNISNVNFGLEQRPQAQLKLNKQVTNVKVTLANNNVLFDASKQASNVVWRQHDAHGPDTGNNFTQNSNYNSVRRMKTPVVRKDASKKGLVQLSMDEELMHGATVQVTYTVMVANIGEVDYKDNTFYYTGTVKDRNSIVKTTINELVDYVGTNYDIGTGGEVKIRNNIQFRAQDNPGWVVIEKEELFGNGDKTKALVNNKLKDQVALYNTVIKNEAIKKDLVPILEDANAVNIAGELNERPMTIDEYIKNNSTSVASTKLVLTQVITADNESDDLRYNNMAEIVKTSNTVGRRNNYSVVGNQDPTKLPIEIDADASQEVVILPPFGQKYIYYALAIGVAIILIGGIIFIQKKVIKKKED